MPWSGWRSGGSKKTKRYSATRRYSKKTSYTRRRRAEAPSGLSPSVRPARATVRISRWGNTLDLVSFNNAGLNDFKVVMDSGGGQNPLSVGSKTADTSGVPNSYQLGGAFKFEILDVPSYQDFTALFDAYRLDQVDIEVSNVHNSSDSRDVVAQMPTIVYCPDWDDAAVPTLASDLSQRQRTKQWTFRGDGKPLKISVKPRASTLVDRDTAPYIAYSVARPTFIDMQYIDVGHFGLKFWLQDLYATAAPTYTGETHLRFKCKYHFTLRDPQ